jgi:prevent-host-death family protein
MSNQTITATTLSRNFSDFLNQVRYQGVTLEITRGAEVIARVSPPEKSASAGYPIDQLDRLLASAPRLSDQEADDFLNDIHAGVGVLHTESDAWDS